MSKKLFCCVFFTWWNGATLNTLRYTEKHGESVGQDEFGNQYYRSKGGAIDPMLGFERRWVIYNGVSEASMTPPGWNGWLHNTVDTPPSEEDYKAPRLGGAASRQSHGTPAAIRPKGSTMRRGRRQASGGDYQAWTPT